MEQREFDVLARQTNSETGPMNASETHLKTPPAAVLLVVAGLGIAVAAWLLPVNLKSVSPALLRAGGEGTPSLTEFGRQLVESEKIGPASLVLAAARRIGSPGTPALGAALDNLSARQPALSAWGGWDPSLDLVFNLRASTGRTASTPVLTFFIPEKARDDLRRILADSGSLGVQDLLRIRDITSTGRFVPASRPGGQPLDALILLTAALYQGEHLSPQLQRQVRELSETAVATRELGDLEPFFFDLLSLGRRLDWVQLSELLRRTESARTVAEYAHLARVGPDQLPIFYAAALFTDSADRVASYVIQYGRTGTDDLSLALSDGQGAAQELLLRQVPVNREAGPALSAAGGLVLAHPQLMLALKYLGCLVGVFLLLRGLDRWIVSPGGASRTGRTLPQLRAGVLATLLAAILVVATEPYLLKAAPPSEYQFHLRLPVLLATAANPPAHTAQTITTMDPITLISIGLFALLQVFMYLVCLRKIAEIERRDASAPLKMRLMENEENLFDSGLYVGMMGTAAALVLQVLGVLPPNLLAAYSSNLFGIVCVALVKIRHVRGYKRQLILEIQGMPTA
jgi:hypothetical protein